MPSSCTPFCYKMATAFCHLRRTLHCSHFSCQISLCRPRTCNTGIRTRYRPLACNPLPSSPHTSALPSRSDLWLASSLLAHHQLAPQSSRIYCKLSWTFRTNPGRTEHLPCRCTTSPQPLLALCAFDPDCVCCSESFSEAGSANKLSLTPLVIR
jgi:hypothetical protein